MRNVFLMMKGLGYRDERLGSSASESGANYEIVQFISTRCLCARNSPYAFHRISQKCPSVAFETVSMFV